MSIQGSKGSEWSALGGESYSAHISRVNITPINAMLSRLNARSPFSSATAIHDVGCGPGPVLSRIIADYGSVIPAGTELSASDFSEGMISAINRKKEESVAQNGDSPWARVRAEILDAMDLETIPDGSQSHVTAGWVYFMLPDPPRGLQEARRVLRDGGCLAVSSWKRSDWMEQLKFAAEIKPGITVPSILDEWRDADRLGEELRKAGFRQVESVEVPTEMGLEDYEGLTQFMMDKIPLLMGLLKDFTEAEKKRYRDLCVADLKRRVPTLPGTLHGTALVAVGTK